MNTIDKCRDFYMNTVAPAIHEKFPEYENRIAVGLVGEGSECFGFDDAYSMDHDFATSICLWLTDEDYMEIGGALNEMYLGLVSAHQGTRLEQRRGVQTISDFYQNILGFSFDTVTPKLTDAQWFYAEDWKLATAVNGAVFRDDLGQFTKIRELIKGFYPERIFLMKLINALHGYAAALQANYPRCMARGDHVAAHACVSRGLEEAMRIAFLLNKTYMPYYKWSYRALQELDPELTKLAELLDSLSVARISSQAWKDYAYDARKINTDDVVVSLSEEIAGILAGMLYARDLIDNNETFLELHCSALTRKVKRIVQRQNDV